jgi:hypothetical protein
MSGEAMEELDDGQKSGLKSVCRFSSVVRFGAGCRIPDCDEPARGEIQVGDSALRTAVALCASHAGDLARQIQDSLA